MEQIEYLMCPTVGCHLRREGTLLAFDRIESILPADRPGGWTYPRVQRESGRGSRGSIWRTSSVHPAASLTCFSMYARATCSPRVPSSWSSARWRQSEIRLNFPIASSICVSHISNLPGSAGRPSETTDRSKGGRSRNALGRPRAPAPAGSPCHSLSNPLKCDKPTMSHFKGKGMGKRKVKRREQVLKRCVCTVCSKPYDSKRLHSTTCSPRCRQQRSRWLRKIARDQAREASRRERVMAAKMK